MLKRENQRKRNLECEIVNWINESIKFDVALGRSKQNFYEEDYIATGQSINALRDKGFRVFIGGGNIFIMKIEYKLEGIVATIVQIRGLARRKIQIRR